MRFRKKPVVVEALQLRWDNWGEMCEFLGDAFFQNGGSGLYGPDHDSIALAITTLEGTMVANQNDWVIRGVKGELYPCKPDIFEATYESVE